MEGRLRKIYLPLERARLNDVWVFRLHSDALFQLTLWGSVRPLVNNIADARDHVEVASRAFSFARMCSHDVDYRASLSRRSLVNSKGASMYTHFSYRFYGRRHVEEFRNCRTRFDACAERYTAQHLRGGGQRTDRRKLHI